jgi:hypothetical protein
MKELLPYKYEFHKEKQLSKEELLNIELALMIIEIQDITEAIFVYKELTSEENAANQLLYSAYYNAVKTSIVYRIVLGLSRVFDTDNSARTLRKVLNVILQTKSINGNPKVNNLISELLEEDERIRETFNFKNLRDKYFAHLDKEMVFSLLPIYKSLKYTDELIDLLNGISDTLIEIAYTCFGEKHSKIDASKIRIPDLGNLKDIEQRARDYSTSNTFANKWFGVNESGLYFLKNSGK